MQALYATLSWACYCFCGGGAVYKENGWVGAQLFHLEGGIKINFGWGSNFFLGGGRGMCALSIHKSLAPTQIYMAQISFGPPNPLLNG